MKEQLSKLSAFLFPFLLVTNIVLIFQIRTLPKQIGEVMEKNKQVIKKDTLIKTITPQLPTKGSFIYFSGEIKGDCFKITEQFDYDPSYPNEIYNGYLTYVKSNDDAEYYIWSKNKIDKSKLPTQLKGWFVTDNLSTFQLNNQKKYLQVLYPIIEHKDEVNPNK